MDFQVRNGLDRATLADLFSWTEAEFDEPITGHCVAEDYRYAAIIRMGCIYIEPRDKTKEELTGQ